MCDTLKLKVLERKTEEVDIFKNSVNCKIRECRNCNYIKINSVDAQNFVCKDDAWLFEKCIKLRRAFVRDLNVNLIFINMFTRINFCSLFSRAAVSRLAAPDVPSED